MKNNGYILVVDNSPVIRRIVSSVLEKEGWLVRTAENGLEALDCIAAHPPEVIFTDLIMPKIDGEKLTFVVRNTPELKHIFMVVLSGVAMEENRGTLQVDADVCIAKGPAATMKTHILAALEKYRAGIRNVPQVEGLGGLYSREVTRELLVSKQHGDIILAGMTEGVVELNHQGRIVMVNAAAVKLFGKLEEELLGTSLAELLAGSQQSRMRQWLAALEPAAALQPLVFDYDEPVELAAHLLTMNLIPVAEEDEVFIIAMIKDVTRRKQLEQQRRQLEKELHRIQKIDAMAVMASGIAHDFNNLLTIISGNMEMSRYLIKEKDQQVAELLQEAGKALGLTIDLIRTFTTFSDNYLPFREEVNLGQLIRETLEQELADTQISYSLEENSAQQPINLDASLMHQVLTNLICNATEAMEESGTISVRLDLVDGDAEAEAIGQPLPRGKLVRLSFQDSGPGIPADIIDQVFDPYFSTKQKGVQKGMGLGLTIVHSLVKKHGGLVWIDSPPDQGCTVYLYFPVRSAVVTDQAFSAHDASPKRVLVMDDDEMMRIINKKMFEHCGCEISLVERGEEAVASYLEAKERCQGYALVLLDLNVDGGMGGLEASRQILEHHGDANLIAVSGDGGNEVILHYEQYGFIAALTKPFSIDTVEAVVQRFLYPVEGC
ncbi:ATP-binding response regulator [Desulfogranum mediterraneum]|uniref:ATP-binding response regulator n=1 Tax=Desulfogranum mediterraneum TaxID=160661 RepID=UPI0003FD3ECC|nr:response regulator [Desulfogranum mediterraneum]